MSREQYTPPTLTDRNTAPSSSTQQQTQQTSNSQSYTGGGFNLTAASLDALGDDSRPIHYLCGDCDARVTLKKGDAIRCKECGYRVLYKERTNR